VGFIDPKKQDGEDGALPGASGLHLDLDLMRCPSCRRELTPWQERCPDCGEPGVPTSQIAPDPFPLPGLALDDEDEEDLAAEDADVGDRGEGLADGAGTDR
jgi:hypothetical protein